MPTPEISVLVPVRNGGTFLEGALRSILSQSYEDFELVVVDDHSTDDTQRRVRSLDDPRIRLIENPGEAGFSPALNTGLEHVRGNYVARMDADDISLPYRLACQLEYMERNTDVSLLGTEIAYIDSDERVRPDVTIRPILPGHVRWALRFYCCLAHPTVMARRGVLQDLGGFDRRTFPAEDHDLWLRALEAGHRLANLPKVLLHYRLNPTGISQGAGSTQDVTSLRLSRSVLERALGTVGLDATALRAIKDARVPQGVTPDEHFLRNVSETLSSSIELAASEGASFQERRAIEAHARDICRRIYLTASIANPSLFLRGAGLPTTSRRQLTAFALRSGLQGLRRRARAVISGA